MKIYTINGNTRKPVDGITAGMLRDSLDTDFTLALTLYNSDARRIKKGTVLEYNGNFFDVATRTKYMNGQAPFVDTTANSIFCRLNRAEYALDSFAVNGTPAEIMTAALHGTPFTFGKTDLTGKYTIVVNETSSRRAVLLTIAAQLHGEIEINGYEISLLAHRGSADEIELLDTGVVSDVQEESDDAEGTTSYSITLLHKVNLKAGDNIHLKFDPLEIDAHTRITAIEYNPYNPLEVNIEVGDYEMDIVDSFISASNEIAAAKHEFKVTSEALTSRIESAEGDISSLEQTAESLTSRITSAEGDVSVLQQTAQSLTSRIESAEGDISSLEQTAESLTATVSTKADKTGGAASTFGYTLTSSTFTLNSNGVAVMQVDKDGGKIKNLTIDGYLYFGGNDEYYIRALHSDTNYYIKLPNFKVDEASGAVFSGKLSAPSGTIGGWTIDTNALYSTKSSKGTGFQTPNAGTWAIAVAYTNQDDWSTASFRVKHDGSMYAANANISGVISNVDSDGWGVKVIENRIEFLQNGSTVSEMYASSGYYRANMTTTSNGLHVSSLLHVGGDLICGKCLGISTGNGIYVSGKLALTMGQIKVQTDSFTTRYLLFYCGILVGISSSKYDGIYDYSSSTY